MKKVALLLVLLVFAAGCIGGRQAKIDNNKGVVINSFSVSPTRTKSGNTVLFDMEMENVGGTQARNVRVDLLGVQDRWRDKNKQPLTSTQQKGPYFLNPPALDGSGRAGDFRPVQWELTTPLILQGLVTPQTVTARVTYDYNTSGYIDIFALTSKELELRRITNQPVPTPAITAANSAGPIKLRVPERFMKTPFILDMETKDEQPVETQTLRIEFANVGDGFPITERETGKITGTIRVSGPGARFDSCFGTVSADGKMVTLDSGEVPARINEDGTFLIACDINITKSAWSDSQPEGHLSLQFDLFYRYFVKKDATVEVVGTGR